MKMGHESVGKKEKKARVVLAPLRLAQTLE